MLPIAEKGIHKVVDAASLEQWTGLGWRLVAVLENESAAPFADLENFPNNPILTPGSMVPYNTGSGYVSATSTRYHQTRAPTFLLMQDEESALAALRHDLAVKGDQLRKTAEELVAQKKVLDAEINANAEIAKNLADLTKASEALRTRVADLGTELKDAKTAHELYRAEVAEKAAQAEAIVERDKVRRRTAYERITEGVYDDRVEDVEERDVG